MKKNILKIIAGVVVFVILLLLIFKSAAEDNPFNKVELSASNSLINNNFPTFYDTIMSVAMDQMGLYGHTVIMDKLSDEARAQMSGYDLKAHVRYFNDNFYLFTDNFDRKEAIEVLCHEVIHIHQYANGELIYGNGDVTWKGETIALDSKEYESRPWENDAFTRQSALIDEVKKTLWSDN